MSAFDATQIGAWERDAEAGIVRCDETAAQLWGLSHREAAEGACIDRLRDGIHTDDRCIFYGRRLCVTTHGSILMSEYRVMPFPGNIRWVLVRGHYHVQRPGQAFAGGRGVIMDITNCRPPSAPACRWSDLNERDEDLEPIHRAADRALALHADVEAMGEDGLAILAATKNVLFQLGRQLSSGVSPTELHRLNLLLLH